MELLLAYLLKQKPLPEGQMKDLLEEALQHIRTQNWEKSLELFIEATMRNKNYAEELPRKGALAILNLLGIQNELNKKYRRKLEMAIF